MQETLNQTKKGKQQNKKNSLKNIVVSLRSTEHVYVRGLPWFIRFQSNIIQIFFDNFR